MIDVVTLTAHKGPVTFSNQVYQIYKDKKLSLVAMSRIFIFLYIKSQ